MLTLIQCPFHSLVTAVARKRHRSFCQKCKFQVTPKCTHTPLTLRRKSELTVPFRHGVGTLQGNELIRNLSGKPRPQSSQLAEPLCTDLGLESGTGARELLHLRTGAGDCRQRVIRRKFSAKKTQPPLYSCHAIQTLLIPFVC